MKPIVAHSPNGRLKLSFMLSGHGPGERGAGDLTGSASDASRKGVIRYRIDLDGNPLVLDSGLQLVFRHEPPLSDGFEIADWHVRAHDETWVPVYGENSTISDRCNELTVDLLETSGRRRSLRLVFRVYDEGAAFRYVIPEQEGRGPFVILREYSEFHFPEGCIGYEEHGTEGEYVRKPVADIRRGCERPLVVEYPDGRYVCLTEAALERYSRMLLSPHKGKHGALLSDLSGPVRGKPPFSTPWRVFIVGDKAVDLPMRAHLVLNLNPPCEIADTSWIKPGKAFRETTLSTRGAIESVDFAAARGIEYIAFDAGWYGIEDDIDADATRVSLDPHRVRQVPGHDGKLDLVEAIRYADSRGIGVFLYVNHKALERQLDELLPVFRSWGVKGIKFGFVEAGDQEWIKWLHDAVRKCASYKLLVDIHDAYRPTGFARTYPNLLTQEGVRGNEHMPDARHNTTLPFVRLPAGPADYTICYYDKRVRNTRAHQMAMAVIMYSPLQFLFWYDRPSDWQGEEETELFRHMPTVWDETIVMDGAIGEYVIMARRNQDEWYMAAITNEHERTLEMDLSFLPAGAEYEAWICMDGDGRTGQTDGSNVILEHKRLTASERLSVRLAASGGCVARIFKCDS